MSSVFQPNLLAGKTAFVTGGSSGICFTMAQQFAAHGANVAILGRNPEKLAAAIKDIGGSALSYSADVRQYDAVENALRQAHDAFGPIDILIAGAAGNFPAPVLGMSANGFKAVIDIDLLGTFNTCRAAHQFLRKPGASVIAISASHAHTPIALQSHVCAAKAGVELLVKTLALEWGPEGIRCNIITPGPTADTEGMRRLAPTPEAIAKVEASVPLRRQGTRQELADLALFLCSPAASFITGSVYNCDGGSAIAGHTLGLS
ncbi:MAG: SDR family oxidoreductase [Acidobacteria bacterium]|nr:SDR family oxidoreductase [Acidobacteriota bacterium]